MKRIKSKYWIVSMAIVLAIGINVGHAQNNPDLYIEQFENGKEQNVTVYQIGRSTIERGGVIFELGPGELIVFDFGWGKPSAMIYHGQGMFKYAPPDQVEYQQLYKFKKLPSLNRQFESATFFFTIPPEDLFAGVSEKRILRKDEWGEFCIARDNALTHLLIYLPNKLLDDLVSAGPGKFFYADFDLGATGHLAFVEDPTQDDWYRIYDIKRSGGKLTADVLAGFSPFDRAPSGRGVMPIDIYHYDISSKIEGDGAMTVRCRLNFVPLLQDRKFIYLDWYYENELIEAYDSQGKLIKVITKKEPYSFIDVNRQESGIGFILNDPLTVGDSSYLDIHFKCGTLKKKSSLYYVRDEKNWYPKTVFRDPATYTLKYDCPAKYEIISSGKKVEESIEGDGRLVRYEVDDPVEYVSFNVGTFERKTIKAEGFPPVVIFLDKEIADASMSKERYFVEQSDTGYTQKPVDVYQAEKYQGEGAEYNPYLDNEAGQLNTDSEYLNEGGSVTNIPYDENGRAPLVQGRLLGQEDQSYIDARDTSHVVLASTDRIGQAGADVANSAAFFASILGYSPFDTLKATSLPENKDSWGAPGLIYLPWDTFLLEDLSGKEESFRAQQVAYQWWGHTVNTEDYRDEWITAGLAKYCGLWYYELSTDNRGSYERMLKDLRDVIFHGEGLEKWEKGGGLELKPLGMGQISYGYDAGPMVLGRRLNSTYSQDYRTVVHSKAAYIFHMIRYLLHDYKAGNDDRFAAFLKDIVARYQNKPISTESLRELLEQHVGGDMTWFFNQWVYGVDIPHYEFSYISSMTPDRKYSITCHITQKKVADDFKMIVPVTVLFKDDKFVHMRIWVTKPEEDIALPVLPYKPEKVIFNTYDAVLCNVKNK